MIGDLGEKRLAFLRTMTRPEGLVGCHVSFLTIARTKAAPAKGYEQDEDHPTHASAVLDVHPLSTGRRSWGHICRHGL